MKLKIVAVGLFSLLFLFALFAGCGSNKNQVSESENELLKQADHDNGVSQGYSDGFEGGYEDGKNGISNPQPHPGSGVSAEFAAGYGEGFINGYEDGNSKAVAEGGSDIDESQEKAAVESAMLSFVKSNAVPGLEFKIQNIIIHENDAAGIAVCTSEKLENALVLMKKDSTGWHGVDFGTGIEPPSWYSY
ncbi:MAG: hypothetical protein A2Y75_11695 [Candidatus Solincola sediminis]|uniref:Uncharacterized protein n=1 Tax=Candidatus Solincola sediminis TaxID=1797199 RepID=A0A1F2WM00_9ACTN|nr:MAG: hypothetical protein A2Y75_11695 [Candidatus Solincola sediminis]